MSAPQDKPNAPFNDDQPPPYSSVMGAASNPAATSYPGAAPYPGTAPSGYPQMGFVIGTQAGSETAPPRVHHPAPSGTYQGAGYPVQGTVYVQQPGMMLGAAGGAMPMNVIVAPAVGTDPVNMYCNTCQTQVVTRVDYQTSWHTHIIAGIICFSTMFFSMCCLGLVPYCLDSCKNAEHFCPNCNAYMGKYERC